MLALILFYFHIEVGNIEDLVKYWKYITILEENQVLPMPNIPLKLTNAKKR